MLDRVDAGPQGCRDAVRADGVRRDRTSDPMRLIDDRLRFGVREVDPAVQHAVGGEVVAPVAVILEPVGAVLHLLAHREPRVVDAVHRLHAVGQLELPVVGGDRIHAGRGHRARRGEHPGTGDLTAIDRVLDVDIGIHRAFGLEIANRREAVLEREPRVTRGEDRTIWGRLLEELVFVLLRGDVALEQQVRVRVDHAGQHRHLAEIDDAGVGCLPLDLRQGSHGLDAVLFNQNADVGLHLRRAAVDQSTGLDEDRLRRRLGAKRRRAQRKSERRERAHEDLRKENGTGELTPVPSQRLPALSLATRAASHWNPGT